MKNKNWKFFLAALGYTALLSACDSFETLTEKKLKEDAHFTPEQAEVGAAVGLRKISSDEEEGEGGNAKYILNNSAIADYEVLYTITGIHQDLEEMLDVHDNFARAKFLKNSGLQPQLEQQVKIFQYHKERLQLKNLHRTFTHLIQGESADSRSKPGDVDEEEKYSLADSFPFQPLPEFEAEYVKAARDDKGNLSLDLVVEQIAEERTFYEKEPNPEYLVDKGKEPERLVQRKHELQITSYNLDGDEEKLPDYIEVYRMTGEKPESLPAIKVFKPNGTGALEIFVREHDREGETGYGIPDAVEEEEPITSGKDLKERPELMDYLFEKEHEQKKQFPQGGEINKVYIVKSGTASLATYETKADGWEQSLPEYHSLSSALNTSGKVNKKITVQIKTDIPEHAEKEKENFGVIQWIALLYEGDARTIEWYKPGPQFKDKKYLVKGVQGRQIKIQEEEEGQIQEYDVKALLEKKIKPYRIDFDKNQQKRWELLDKDHDGIHYEAKREKAMPDEVWPIKEKE